VNLAELKQAICNLKPKQRLQVAEWLQGEVRSEESERLDSPGTEIVEERVTCAYGPYSR
jgi:hypothetical protein